MRAFLLAGLAIVAAGCLETATQSETPRPDAGLSDLRGQGPGPYLEDASDVERVRGFLRDPPTRSIECEPDSFRELNVKPVDNATALGSALENWYVTCVGIHVGAIYTETNPERMMVEAEAAIRNGTERQFYDRYHAEAEAALENLFALLDEPSGSIVDAEIKAAAMGRAAGLLRINERGESAIDRYEADQKDNVQRLRNLVGDQFFSALDARSMAAVLDAYPWSTGSCDLPDPAGDSAAVEARLLQVAAEGRATAGTEDGYGDPIDGLEVRARGLLNLSRERGWGEGVLAVSMDVESAHRSWQYYGETVTLEEAAIIIAHELAVNRSIQSEEMSWNLERMLANPGTFELNPTAGAEYLALIGMENPFLDLRCTA